MDLDVPAVPDSTLPVDLAPASDRGERRRFATITSEWSIGLFGSAVSIVFNYAATVVAVHFLTASEYGLFTLSLSVVDLALIPVLFGMPSVISRYVPYYDALGQPGKSKHLIHLVLRVTGAASLVTALALFLGAGVLSERIFFKPGLETPLRLVLFSLPLLAVTETASYTFIAFKQLRYQVYTRKLFQPLLRLCLGAVMLYAGYGLIGWVWTYLASLALGVVLATVLFRRHVTPRLSRVRAEPVDFREIGAYAGLLGLYSALLIVIGQTDILLLGRFRSAAEIGSYNVYLLICTLLTVTETSVNQLYKAFASELIAQKAFRDLASLYRRISQAIFAANLLVLLVILLFGTSLVVLFTNRSYLQAPAALSIVAVGWVVSSAFGPWDLTLQALAVKRLWFLNGLTMLTIKLLIGLVMIPRFGIIGAAFAASSGAVAGAILGQVEIYRLHRLHPFGPTHAKCLLAGAASAAVVLFAARWFPPAGRIQVLLLIGLLTALYGAVLYFSHSLNRADYEFLLDRLKRARSAR